MTTPTTSRTGTPDPRPARPRGPVHPLPVRIAAMLAALLLATVATAQVEPEAAEWLERAREAHGGAALERLSTYRDEGVLVAYDPTGAAVQETPFRTLVDLAGERVRMEVLAGDEVALVQQVTPEGAFAWTAQGGEIPLTPEQASELRLLLRSGVYGLRRGAEGADAAVLLGERTFEDVTGQAVEVTRDGRTVTFLLDEDGRLLAERYTTAQLGETTNVYRAFETVDGVKLPTAYDAYASGVRLLSSRIETLEANPPLTDADFATERLAGPPEVTPEALDWLRSEAIPLESVDAGSGVADLRAFGDLVGDARIVALGEQTHGTSEFFRMKHRLLEYLVTEKGFTLFAIEANMPEAERLNRYVLTGEGDPAELLAGLYFWTWNTREVLDMIEWMRAYNETADITGAAPVRFTGFDMQYPDVAVENVRDFLARVDSDLLTEVEGTLDAVLAGSPLAAPTRAAEGGESLLSEVEALVERMEAGREAYLERADAREVDRAIQNARVIAQAVGLATGGTPWRDRAMAENVQWLLDRHPGEKMVIWAHNGHVAEREGWMGAHLAEAYGDDYLSVAFSFYEGEYTAAAPEGGVSTHTAEPALAGSVDALLERVGPPRFILDLRGAEDSPAAPWLAEERPFRSIGALAAPASAAFAPIAVADDFDAVVFIRESTASERLE